MLPRERDLSGAEDRGGLALWLVWLLPPLGLLVVLSYVLSVKLGVDLRVVLALIAHGRGGEVLAGIAVALLWALTQVFEVAAQNWPLVVVGAAAAALVWVLRYL